MGESTKLVCYAGNEGKSTRTRGPSGPRPPRQTLRREDRFTGASLQKLMQDHHVIKPPMKMPSAAALEKLASILERWRGDYWHHQHIAPLEKEIADGAGKMFPALEKLRKIYEDRSDIPADIAKKVDAINQALVSIARLYTKSIAVEHGGSLNWGYLNNAWPVDFANAIQTTNPNYKIGIGHTGPLVRFITAVTPCLTGESTTPESVATQLKGFLKLYPGHIFGQPLPFQDCPTHTAIPDILQGPSPAEVERVFREHAAKLNLLELRVSGRRTTARRE
jgi:hypothetical protein